MATELRDMKVAVADNVEITQEMITFLQRDHTFAHQFNDAEYILHINIQGEDGVPEEIKDILKEAEDKGFEYVCFYSE